MTQQSQSLPTSGRSRESSSGGGGRRALLFLLSREATDIPEGEAVTLVRDLDPSAAFESPEPGILIARTSADQGDIEGRVAFSRRVGHLVPEGLDEPSLEMLRRGTYRVRVFGHDDEEEQTIGRLARQIGGKVSLENPESELTVVQGRAGRYLVVTRPTAMRQGWSKRRPRARAFFHPAAIFPKLSRALVNLSGVRAGEFFLDPFAGTGSLLIEAHVIGALPVGMDRAKKMVFGAKRNAAKFGQPWPGVIRADARNLPIGRVDAIATDIPYGRASSALGRETGEIMSSLLENAAMVLPTGRKLVVMHPQTLPVASTAQLEVEQEHNLFIHKKLTRTITVLRRKGAAAGERS